MVESTLSKESSCAYLPVILGLCGFNHTKIADFQSVNDPSMPLSKMSKQERDEIWNKVIEIILNPESS